MIEMYAVFGAIRTAICHARELSMHVQYWRSRYPSHTSLHITGTQYDPEDSSRSLCEPELCHLVDSWDHSSCHTITTSHDKGNTKG